MATGKESCDFNDIVLAIETEVLPAGYDSKDQENWVGVIGNLFNKLYTLYKLTEEELCVSVKEMDEVSANINILLRKIGLLGGDETWIAIAQLNEKELEATLPNIIDDAEKEFLLRRIALIVRAKLWLQALTFGSRFLKVVSTETSQTVSTSPQPE